jgi:hypothetical protein
MANMADTADAADTARPARVVRERRNLGGAPVEWASRTRGRSRAVG